MTEQENRILRALDAQVKANDPDNIVPFLLEKDAADLIRSLINERDVFRDQHRTLSNMCVPIYRYFGGADE